MDRNLSRLTRQRAIEQQNAKLPVRRFEFYPYFTRALEHAASRGDLWPVLYPLFDQFLELKQQDRRARRMRRWYWRVAYAIRFLFTGRRPVPRGGALPGAAESVRENPGKPGEQDPQPEGGPA